MAATIICPVCQYMYQIVPREPLEDSEAEPMIQIGGDDEDENDDRDEDDDETVDETADETAEPTNDISEDPSDLSDALDVPHYHCRNCGNYEPIPARTEVYSRSYHGEKTFEDYQMAFDDPTLARTRQYHCPKKSCPTHKDPQSKKAIITKTAEGQVVYLCTICRSDWHPVFQ